MKKDNNFWRSLEKYTRAVFQRSPVPYSWIAIGIICVVLFTSLLSYKTSFVSVESNTEAASLSADLGDYETAKKLLNESTPLSTDVSVLGAKSELEDKIYPERVVEKQIAILEEKILDYPGNREIYIELSSLYKQLGNSEKSDEYREKARVLDPNEVKF